MTKVTGDCLKGITILAFNQEIMTLDLDRNCVKMGKDWLKKRLHGDNCRMIPLTDQGPSRRRCYIVRSVEHRIRRNLFGRSEMKISQNFDHLARSVDLTYSNKGGLPNSFP